MKVMVAIDESEASLYALQWSIEKLFLRLRHETAADPVEEKPQPPQIMVVHVQPPFQTYTPVPVGPALFATPAVMDSVKHAQDESATEVFSRATKLCEQHTIKAEMMVIRGSTKEMIIEAAEQLNADLLVVGSRGHGQIKRAFWGSISDYCVHNAKCPVLIVGPPKSSNK